MYLHSTIAGEAWSLLSRSANSLFSGVIIAGALVFLVALRLNWIDIVPHTGDVSDTPRPDIENAATEVSLPPAKYSAAKLSVAAVQVQSIRPTRTLPGTLVYDAAKRVPIHAPVAGLITHVLVEPSQAVSAHQPLAILSSHEVGPLVR